MSWMDIAILALVVLLGVLGIFKGFKKSAVAAAAFIVAFVLAFLLTNVITEALLSVPVINKFVLGSDGFSLYKWIEQGLSPDATSAFLQTNFYKPINEIITNVPAGYYSETFTAHQGLSLYLAYLVFAAIIGVCLFLVIRLLLSIVTVIVKSYIGKKKSVAGRLFGFVVGAVRGVLWTLAITIVFTSIGGLTFSSGIKAIETEYEESVIAKMFNGWSYSIRNKLFLPDSDAYQRIVELSGIRKVEEPEEPPEGPGGEETDPELTKARFELYCSIMNFNYTDTAFYVDDNGQIVKSENAKLIKSADFADSEFDTVVKAITDYNKKTADAILADDGILADVDLATLKNYIKIVEEGDGSVYDMWNEIYPLILNYNLEVTEGKALTSATLIAETQEKIEAQYAALVEKIDAMIAKYASVKEFDELKIEYPGSYQLVKSEE